MINENDWDVVCVEIPFPDGREREVLAKLVHYRPGVEPSVFGAPEDCHQGEEEEIEFHLYHKNGTRLPMLEDYVNNNNLEDFVLSVLLPGVIGRDER